jgi:hypothetical protein
MTIETHSRNGAARRATVFTPVVFLAVLPFGVACDRIEQLTGDDPAKAEVAKKDSTEPTPSNAAASKEAPPTKARPATPPTAPAPATSTTKPVAPAVAPTATAAAPSTTAATDEFVAPGEETLLTKLVCQVETRNIFGPAWAEVSSHGFTLARAATRCAPDGKTEALAWQVPTNGGVIALAADGGILYGAIEGGKGKIAKAKLDGTPVWVADDFEGRLSYGRPPRASTFDGGKRIFAVADATQLLGEAPELATLPVIVQLDDAGKRRWVQRVPAEMDAELSMAPKRRPELAADTAGNLFLASQPHVGANLRLSRFDPDGKSVWTNQHTDFYFVRMQTQESVIRVSPNGVHVYAATEKSLTSEEPGGLSAVHGGAAGIRVLKSNRDGKVVWYKNLVFMHSTVLDPVEQAEWLGGRPNTQWEMIASDDGTLCVVADYSHRFRNGSSPRKNYTSLLVACFDSNGSFEWSRQYRVGPAGDPTKEAHSLHFLAAGWVADGRLGVVGRHELVGSVREDNTAAFILSRTGDVL